MALSTDLFETLDRRARPEIVASLIAKQQTGSLTSADRCILNKTTKHLGHGYSSMSDDFVRVQPMDRQLQVASILFGLPAPGGLDMPEIHTFIDAAGSKIHKERGRSDFKYGRLDRNARRVAGLGDMSRRRYNKLFRLLSRMEEKERKTLYELEKRGMVQVSKARLASRLKAEDLVDPITLAFVAYFTARCNMRSRFTVDGQDSPYDEIADMLLARCHRHPDATSWWAVAHVYPIQEVIARLSDEQRGRMLGIWNDILRRTAKILKGVWDASDIQRHTMTVKRGNDSTTWNVMAGAWNKARDGWIGYIYALGMDQLIEQFCPGKCMRLIAADVAAWHRSAGHTGDPNQHVWNEVPLPWEVMDEVATCTRQQVVAVCRKHKLDPEKSGWVAPRPAAKPRPFKPTPELVHGVTVSDPTLALMLRRAGWFSGGAAEFVDGVDVERDEHGAAVLAKPAVAEGVKSK
jgi:hypothetical protein